MAKSPPLLPVVPRRVVLRAVLVGALPAILPGIMTGGCTAETGPPDRGRGGAPTPVEPDPDIALAATALVDEQAALDALRATVARHRALDPALSPMVDAHRMHISLLARAAPSDATAPTQSRRYAVPADVDAARVRVGSLEHDLSIALKRQAFSARSGAFARLLASMAAACAQHSAVLAALADDRVRS